MNNLYGIGSLSEKALARAKEILETRILRDGPMKIEQPIDILPPPTEEGQTIMGASLMQYLAVADKGGTLHWEAQGLSQGNEV